MAIHIGKVNSKAGPMAICIDKVNSKTRPMACGAIIGTHSVVIQNY